MASVLLYYKSAVVWWTCLSLILLLLCSYKYCFEVATAKRPYLFCAEREFEMQQWVGAFQKVDI